MRESIVLRPAKREDCIKLMGLIQELADYEKLPTKCTVAKLEEDGFGPEPFFHCIVAEDTDQPGKLLGHAIFFYTYSTYEGRSVYMEDLYVKKEHRGHGIGMALWRQVVQASLTKGCNQCCFEVLDWNKPSIDFYKSFGAENFTEKEGWFKFKLDKDAMTKFVANDQ